jgi:hypothetical protein
MAGIYSPNVGQAKHRESNFKYQGHLKDVRLIKTILLHWISQP